MAVVFPDGFKLDVASARLEYYLHPGALPDVEHASLKLDLYRRDFSINALALRLTGSQRAQLVREVTAALEDFDTQRAGAQIAGFVDDLSNWYVRRNRRRFWDGDPAALWTARKSSCMSKRATK